MYKILFVLSMFDSPYSFKEAEKILGDRYCGAMKFDFMYTHEIDKDNKAYFKAIEKGKESDFIFIGCHGGLTNFKRFKDFFNSLKRDKKFFISSGIDDEVKEVIHEFNITLEEYAIIYKYYNMGNTQNIYNMALWLASNYGDFSYEYEDPIPPKWEGVYDKLNTVYDEYKYIKEIRKDNKPIIGIVFHFNNLMKDNLLHIDALINRVKQLGAVPLPCYTGITKEEELNRKGIYWLIDNYFIQNGETVVDAVIMTVGYSMSILGNPGDGTKTVEESVFEKLGVPVFQALTTYFTLEQWEKSITGLDAMSLISGIYFPEFDGQIITVPIAYNEFIKDEVGTKIISKPIKDRVDKVCRLAYNWANLRYKNNKSKKAAIIFHNMPPRNDMIGCAFGLDSPATVYHIVEAMKKEGIKTDYDFIDGGDIIQRIIEGVTNDTSWLSSEAMLERSVDIIEGEAYRDWFSSLSDTVKKKLIKDWGQPPGDFMVHDDKLPVPGIINGNIFIGLQPPRAFEEKAEECYHSTDIVCPHQYIAFYKWIKNSFKADIIIHIGTHGTLEWLPGKEKGLSKDCYPDIVIDDIPHLYPYNIGVLGEGIQAKRRSHAAILEHMIPSLVESDAYDELSEIDDLIKEYYHSKRTNTRKISYIESNIWEAIEKNSLNTDLKITKEEALENFDEFIEKLHTWVGKIKASVIKDGLHVFGQIPKGNRYKNMIRSLVRIKNGNVASLNEAISEAMGWDYNRLIDNPTQIWENGKTSLMILDKITEASKRLIDELEKKEYNTDTIELVIGKALGKEEDNTKKLIGCLTFICEDLIYRLNSITDEINYLVKGVNGEFISPGPGGSPTRGRARILPTGKNFYSIDPSAVPTRSSWDVGKMLANDVINRYLDDEEKYPESIAIVIYSGETMKTCGDDIGKILYLLGVKPVWLGNTDKVIGLEIIPLERLKRPRIDVTLRISGLFRDTFPNLIELIDEAVSIVANLDEDIKSNFVKKHVIEEVEELIEKGMNREEAQKESLMRIFGCPPGTYGAGVDILINSKKWNHVNDLGKIFTSWGCHAYGKSIHGEKKEKLFSKRLSKTDVTVKNESSIEIDMLESDDFYNYHGGLIAAVRTHRGKKPRSYCGNSANPEKTELLDIQEETARIMRARINNPKWIEGLKKHGYKGAQEVAAMVDIAFGWDATSDVIEDWMYEKITDNFVFNKENREWIEKVNKWAMHSMVDKLLEAIQRGMWNAPKEYKDELIKMYLKTEGNIEEYV